MGELQWLMYCLILCVILLFFSFSITVFLLCMYTLGLNRSDGMFFQVFFERDVTDAYLSRTQPGYERYPRPCDTNFKRPYSVVSQVLNSLLVFPTEPLSLY